MAHFVNLNSENIVVDSIVISNLDAGEPNFSFPATDVIGQHFIVNVLNKPGNWKQTSYNEKFRKRYAGFGYTYDADNDVFIAPKPFSSWILNEDFDWEPPIPQPDTENVWLWNEEDQKWDEFIPPSQN